MEPCDQPTGWWEGWLDAVANMYSVTALLRTLGSPGLSVTVIGRDSQGRVFEKYYIPRVFWG